jgi:hypothetical protein
MVRYPSSIVKTGPQYTSWTSSYPYPCYDIYYEVCCYLAEEEEAFKDHYSEVDLLFTGRCIPLRGTNPPARLKSYSH